MRTNENQRGVVSAVKEEMLSLDKLLALRPLLSYHVVARMSEIGIRRRSVHSGATSVVVAPNTRA